MTIALQPPVGQHDDLTWRVLRDGLWTARRDGRHLGTIEHGHRWLAADAEGEPIAAFRTFQEAQAAVADPAAHRHPAPRRTATRPALAVALLCTAALVTSVGSVWSGLLF